MIRNPHAFARACATPDSTVPMAAQSSVAAGAGALHPGGGDTASP